MPALLAPLLRPVTYTRWLHLMVGLVFAGVLLLVYPGTEGVPTGRVVLGAVGLDVPLLCLVALVPGVRRGEGVQARLLLGPAREEEIGVAPSAGWADRGRTACWLVARVALSVLLGAATVAVVRAAADLPLLAPPAAFALLWLVVWAGRLQLALAVRLLGPSGVERLAAAEARAERLLERNRLARELHDSIGHALTVTVVQAGAAREIPDQAFREGALAAIETTGRRALDDLERMLVLLRETPDAAATERPGLDRAAEILAAATAAGSPVDARLDVRAAELPGVLSREAYRILQEGVTNALRHAPGAPIRIRAALDAGTLELECRNARTGGGSSRRGGGKGLRGVRERAVLLGGDCAAGPDGPDWLLRVRLPLRLGR
ncbi:MULTISPECIES: histidine kinase [Kitasatospora]|uniref:histidine kinase n=1 Tax=Kitasatospora setae (strain ATCC 33774 / DSM 43861 / JCM 3304 / KCC A-0304 / NBRC 14216 / KM-6054) TaxID=452652 RepID=E4NCE7_KITSK|nr:MULTISPECIES: histidine kinase [Kitasatospora]BAJ28878.1 putative two-component system sensor kinase [Kitasatospora setae KM-6054]